MDTIRIGHHTFSQYNSNVIMIKAANNSFEIGALLYFTVAVVMSVSGGFIAVNNDIAVAAMLFSFSVIFFILTYYSLQRFELYLDNKSRFLGEKHALHRKVIKAPIGRIIGFYAEEVIAPDSRYKTMFMINAVGEEGIRSLLIVKPGALDVITQLLNEHFGFTNEPVVDEDTPVKDSVFSIMKVVKWVIPVLVVINLILLIW